MSNARNAFCQDLPKVHGQLEPPARFSQPLQPVIEPVIEPASPPVIQPTSQAVIEPASQPIKQHVAEPVCQPVNEPEKPDLADEGGMLEVEDQILRLPLRQLPSGSRIIIQLGPTAESFKLTKVKSGA